MQDSAVELLGDRLHIQFPFSIHQVELVKSVLNARWNLEAKAWVVPYSIESLRTVKRLFPTIHFGPTLKEVAAHEAESLFEAAERKYLPNAKEVQITDFTFATDPFLHQKVSFNFARALDCAALFLEQGLGKAKIGIDLATWRFRQGQIERVLVLCPNSVLGQWIEEIRKHGHDDFRKSLLLLGSTTQRVKLLETMSPDVRWILLNYDGLKGLQEYLNKRQAKKPQLFGMMMLDESSKIKHAQTQRSKIAWKMGQTVKYRNILSGTPITQSAEDVFSQYRFLKPTVFGPYATAFRAQYLVMGGFENRQIMGYRNMEDFLAKVYGVAIRFTKDKCLDLPPKVYEVRTVRLDDDASKQYRQLEKDCILEIKGQIMVTPLLLTKIMKLSQLTGGFIYNTDDEGKKTETHMLAKNPKLEAVDDILDEVLPAKVIIWTRFMQEIICVESLLKKRKLNYRIIQGSVSAEDRAKAVKDFQEDPTVSVFIGQVSTAGFGITLTAASVVIYYANTYALEDRLQSEDRCHRIGQTKSVTYIDLLAETSKGGKTVDHDVLKIIKGKAAFATEISDALIRSMEERTRQEE